MEVKQLFSVGHSNQSIEEFYQLLESQKIDCILDVRSMPYSKYTPHFNEEPLKNWLNKHGVLYAPFGKHFGARRSDCLKETEFIKNGIKEVKPQVNFELGVTTSDFKSGVERLNKALDQNRRVSLTFLIWDGMSSILCVTKILVSRFRVHIKNWKRQ